MTVDSQSWRLSGYAAIHNFKAVYEMAAARYKAWTLCAPSNAGFVGSNPTQRMDVCVRLFCVCVVLCICRGRATGWSLFKESYRLCIGLRNWKEGQGPTKDCRWMDGWIGRKFLNFSLTPCQFSWKGDKTDGLAQDWTVLTKCRRAYLHVNSNNRSCEMNIRK
jgi:hypothetical protein